MTITTAPAVTGRPYPVENLWRKGCYVARVTGRHPQYVFDREFLNGAPHKARRIVAYGLKVLGGPGWAVLADPWGRHLIELLELCHVDHGTDFESHEILAIFEAGPPGTPGAWTGDRCESCSRPQIGESCEQCSRSQQARDLADAIAGDKEDPF